MGHTVIVDDVASVETEVVDCFPDPSTMTVCPITELEFQREK